MVDFKHFILIRAVPSLGSGGGGESKLDGRNFSKSANIDVSSQTLLGPSSSRNVNCFREFY